MQDCAEKYIKTQAELRMERKKSEVLEGAVASSRQMLKVLKGMSISSRQVSERVYIN